MTSSKDKDIVKSNYNKIAQKYTEWVSTSPSLRLKYLDLVLSNLPPNSRILELGTGAGTPVLNTLVQIPTIEKIYANDISSSQLQLAQKSIQDERVEWSEGDMLQLNFEEGCLDAILAFYSIFHLPREEQKVMLAKCHVWLKPGGKLVMNFGTTDEEEIRSADFFGEEMFWSSYGVAGNLKMLEGAGFEVLKHEVKGSADGNLKPGDVDYGIEFLWVFAEKKK
ncbi:Malonyl-[acyl-carrier protein] O-methyltransferase [Pseudocercospora fuligena]|uniref:Malonyl-[acyl-carrier protein] O-methyltransferase n=1 Tax=Pseudocercospora fuligena TaxID=685502 RepID=A0A8H6RMU4_9PEZI|nr:Malonyl-[acyl-carrier protein] O-methyltransferase [Pseudocercospora fuligena]